MVIQTDVVLNVYIETIIFQRNLRQKHFGAILPSQIAPFETQTVYSYDRFPEDNLQP
jgi:hypothetical protein